jgi:hypothetical protein
VGYLVTTILVVLGGAAALGVMVVRHENRPAIRQASMVRLRVPKMRVIAAGERCRCGGTVGNSGRTSPQFGDLLGCTGCDRTWTMNGRKIIRR